MLILLSLTISPLFVGAKITDANNAKTINVDNTKHLLDEQFLQIRGLSSQPAFINSVIEVHESELASLLGKAPVNNG
jgi:hypothetical protein